MEEPEILVRKISLEKVLMHAQELDSLFGHWLLTKMQDYGLPLFLIHHPEEIHSFLQDAEPVGLEVNIPLSPLQDVYPGKRQKRVDLIFRKGNIYFLVEAKSRKPTTKDRELLREYAKRFREFVLPHKRQVFPIMIYPDESPQKALFSLLTNLKNPNPHACTGSVNS